MLTQLSLPDKSFFLLPVSVNKKNYNKVYFQVTWGVDTIMMPCARGESENIFLLL